MFIIVFNLNKEDKINITFPDGKVLLGISCLKLLKILVKVLLEINLLLA